MAGDIKGGRRAAIGADGVKAWLLSGIWAHLDAGVQESPKTAGPISFATVPSLNAEL